MATDNVKITKRDNYNTLYEIVSNASLDPEVEARLHAFIDRELELMNQRTEKQKKYQKNHDAAHDALSDGIFALLQHSPTPLTLRDIAAKVEGATTQKATYRLSKMYDEGFVLKETQSINTENGKRRATVYWLNPDLHSEG